MEERKRSAVSVVRCESYDEEKVYDAVKRAVGYLGGIESFVSKEERVLLKPDFLYLADAEKCITTHPSVIKAAVRLLTEGGYVFKCGDSPANGTCSAAFEKLGLDKSVIAPMDSGVKKGEFMFASDVLEADAVIGLSKMKTHALERITGAVKNMYGLIYAKNKAKGHVNHPGASDFARMLCEIHRATPQRLHIMDAVTAMEGNGPASGTPVDMGLILASSDSVALDTVFCYLIDLDPKSVPTNACGDAEGIGTCRKDEIDILMEGEIISAEELLGRYGKPDFDVQREKDRLSFLGIWSRLTGRFAARPRIDESKCLKCGVCVEHCPVDGHALSFADGRDRAPVYDYSKCIRCYCCQELCPGHAISAGRKR